MGYLDKDYSDYSAADFALDEFFIRWVLDNSPDTDRFWRQWLKSNPSKKEEVDAARTIVRTLRFKQEPLSYAEIQMEWNALRNKLQSPEAAPIRTLSTSRTISLRHLLNIAATVLLAAMLFYLFRLNDNTEATAPLIERYTAAAETISLILPDGSVVVLNSNSRISYPEKFPDDHRKVHLKGEAYFDVVSDSTRPFSVITDNITTNVLGTSFDVRAYPADEEIAIALVEGRVKVRQQLDSLQSDIYLHPTQMLTLNREDTVRRIEKFHALETLGWKDGILYFNKVSFTKAITRIEDWYGVEIEIAPGVKLDTSWRFNGRFQHQTLDEVLKAFSYPKLFKYQINDKTVVIYEGG